MRKKSLTFLLALAASVGMMNAATDDSGSCGANVTYSFNGTTGAMTITGTGPMTNFASMSAVPWDSYRDDITSVTITDGVTSVGSYSFGYHENLVTVTIGNDVETIGYYAFGDCYKFTTLNLGNSVKHIGDRAFMWAKVLTGFTLPSTLETIGERAFLQNKVITSLTIPSNVTSIGEAAFYYCAALTSITTEATTPPSLGVTVFDYVPTSIPLYVPTGSVAAYTAAAQWNAFNIQGSDPAPTPTPSGDEEVVVITTNTSQSSYTQSTVTITCDYEGDEDGFAIGGSSSYTATITNSGSSTISKIELVPGYYKNNHPYVRANGAEPTSSSRDLITFTDVNSNSVTLSMSTTDNFQIEEVRVTLVGGGSTPTPAVLNITANQDPQNTGVYYATFFDSSVKYTLPAGVEAYVATINVNVLDLTKIAEAGQVIPANNAVILKSTVSPFTLTPSDAESVTFTATNNLQGSDTQIATPANCYVLSGVGGVVGFYQYTDAQVAAHKAYVIYSGTNAPQRMRFVFTGEQTATGIENTDADANASNAYKIIRDGQLIIIRNGVEYNVNGQEVK